MSPLACNSQPTTTAGGPLKQRRKMLTLALVPLLAAALPGCNKAPIAYKGMDITGAQYARGFQLKDAQDKVRTLADFQGKAVMLFFGFTQCPDVCPTALIRAAEIRQLLGEDGPRLQVVFITIDPERDNPTVLDAYTRVFDPSFIGLYGDLEQTASVASEFKVYYKKVPTGASYTMDHSALSYVFDPEGKPRLVLRHEQSARECAEDLRQLLHST
ncbi:MAG: SCO family protein [Alcaligenaceae bacterium]|nr:MAG: SCO family protein [Alcaligenaceae bacterium]